MTNGLPSLLQVAGSVGRTYRIESASQPANESWSLLETVTPDLDPIPANDPSSATNATRFFRAAPTP